jgi:hypothetical protein
MPETARSPARALLIALYPRDWRARYGEELEGLLAERRLSPAIVFDLLGGALDARLEPRLQPTDNHGANDMNLRHWKTCAASVPQPTVRQSLFGAGLILLATLALTTVFGLLKQKFGPVPAVSALRDSLFTLVIALSCTTMYMHQRSWRAQAAFVLFVMSLTYLIFLAAESI